MEPRKASVDHISTNEELVWRYTAYVTSRRVRPQFMEIDEIVSFDKMVSFNRSWRWAPHDEVTDSGQSTKAIHTMAMMIR